MKAALVLIQQLYVFLHPTEHFCNLTPDVSLEEQGPSATRITSFVAHHCELLIPH
jgi:hypothetical protein